MFIHVLEVGVATKGNHETRREGANTTMPTLLATLSGPYMKTIPGKENIPLVSKKLVQQSITAFVKKRDGNNLESPSNKKQKAGTGDVSNAAPFSINKSVFGVCQICDKGISEENSVQCTIMHQRDNGRVRCSRKFCKSCLKNYSEENPDDLLRHGNLSLAHAPNTLYTWACPPCRATRTANNECSLEKYSSFRLV